MNPSVCVKRGGIQYKIDTEPVKDIVEASTLLCHSERSEESRIVSGCLNCTKAWSEMFR